LEDDYIGHDFLEAQTLQNLEIWPEALVATKKRWTEPKYRGAIGRATFYLQNETRRLRRIAQALVARGGQGIAPTPKRLAEIGRKAELTKANQKEEPKKFITDF
jgi:hypothetical protein